MAHYLTPSSQAKNCTKLYGPSSESFPKRNSLEPFKAKVCQWFDTGHSEPVSCKLGELRHQKGRAFWLETKEKFVKTWS